MEGNLAEKPKTDFTPARPFLKWAGGKGQLLDVFQNYFPKVLAEGKIENYYEPFLGGGAVFFKIIQEFQIDSAWLYDNNRDLILTYRSIRDDVSGLIQELDQMGTIYIDLDEVRQKEYFYQVRNDFNSQLNGLNYKNLSKALIKRAAQVIFLNRICFNGLFRFNSKGEFNVPHGRYKNPRILDAQNLEKVSKLLAGASIKHADFREIAKDVKKRSFVYYDPPYRPLNRTSHFTAYSKENFGDAEQKELAKLFAFLDKKKVLQMLSNSDPKNHDPGDDFFDELYRDFQIFRVPARRAINSNAAKRSAINEIIVTNYPVRN
jgi:DNA adenine methylase